MLYKTHPRPETLPLPRKTAADRPLILIASKRSVGYMPETLSVRLQAAEIGCEPTSKKVSMSFEYPDSYDVVVVGAGHTGCEAALAAARMGASFFVLTGNLEMVAQMSCNPAIGGVAKGHIVKEIDALGGEMASVIDQTGIQFRRLNASKGPAVRSTRAQADKRRYREEMRRRLELQPNLYLRQAEVAQLHTEQVNGRAQVRAVTTTMGVTYRVNTVILTTGTFLRGKIFVGEARAAG